MYDVAMSVGPQHKEISRVSIRAVLEYLDPGVIYIITNRNNFSFYQQASDIREHIRLIDEETLIPGVSISTLRSYLQDNNANPDRAGWYLQQFLTMAACTLPAISDHYLILDADTVFLRKVKFFDDDGRVLYVPETENHQPYFDTYEKLLLRKRSVDHSCISEHFMVNKQYMLDLIDTIASGVDNKNKWPFIVMDTIEKKHLSGAGFADYETYGNFVISEHKETIKARKLKHLRNSAKRFGSIPAKEDLYRLSLFYHYASFEVWNPRIPLRIMLEKSVSKMIYFFEKIFAKAEI